MPYLTRSGGRIFVTASLCWCAHDGAASELFPAVLLEALSKFRQVRLDGGALSGVQPGEEGLLARSKLHGQPGFRGFPPAHPLLPPPVHAGKPIKREWVAVATIKQHAVQQHTVAASHFMHF